MGLKEVPTYLGQVVKKLMSPQPYRAQSPIAEGSIFQLALSSTIVERDCEAIIANPLKEQKS